jgi:hypothetical protein
LPKITVDLNFPLLSCVIGILNLNKKAAPFIVQLFFMFFKNILVPTNKTRGYDKAATP